MITSPPVITVVEVPIDDLRPDPANPRRIADAELEALTRSLKEWGFVQPILARREDNTVIGGHQRLLAARRLGYKTVPVVWLTLSGFSEDELDKLLKSLDVREKRERQESFDLDAALEDARAAPRAQRGEIWALGDHRLLCGDATGLPRPQVAGEDVGEVARPALSESRAVRPCKGTSVMPARS